MHSDARTAADVDDPLSRPELRADDNASWKAIARRRLAQLDGELARLRHSRQLLAGALLCRYDHPLDECRIMNSEISRRLTPADPAQPRPTAGGR